MIVPAPKSGAWRTALIDVLFAIVLILLVVIVALLPLINPPAEDAKAEPPGNLIVAITWPEGNTDVDLWVNGPGEPVPVGYSNKGGVLWNLLRDDLGKHPDASPLNYENAFTRGIVQGTYTVNVHCYRCPEVPVPVDVEVSLNTGEAGKGSLKRLITTQIVLHKTKQERTAIDFAIDAKGQVIRESMNNIFQPLRGAGKQQ